MRDEGLLKLFFADSLSEDERLELIAAMRAEHEAVIERLREIESLAAERGGSPLLVHSYGIGLHEWAARWLGQAEHGPDDNPKEEPDHVQLARKSGE